MNLVLLICTITQVMGFFIPAGLGGKIMNQLKNVVNPIKGNSKITTAFNSLDSPSTTAEIASWSNSKKASALDKALSLSKLGHNNKPLHHLLEVTDNADLSSIVRNYGGKRDFKVVFQVLPHGNAKTLDSAFKLFPSVNDPKYLDDLFKALLNRKIPGGNRVIFENFRSILSSTISSSKNDYVRQQAIFKIFMENMDYMNGLTFRKKDPNIGILESIRNINGVRDNPLLTEDINRYTSAYIYIKKIWGGLDVGQFEERALLRMDSPKLNNEILKAAIRRNDEDILQYLRTFDARKFGLNWRPA